MIRMKRAAPEKSQIFVANAPLAETHAHASWTAIKSGIDDCASRFVEIGVVSDAVNATTTPTNGHAAAARNAIDGDGIL